MITLRSRDEIALIRKAGHVVRGVLAGMEKEIRPGITTRELDDIAIGIINANDAQPAFKGYRGFPASICTSINEVVVHGIPSRRVLKEGDIISIDVGVKLKGYFADGASTFAVGRISPEAKELIETTRRALTKGITMATPKNRLSDISHTIQTYAEQEGFSVVRAFVGHGIGAKMHEAPEIPNFGKPNRGIRLEPGMVLAIEPMINAGGYEVKILDDGWTAVTKDGSWSAHFEHTIAVCAADPEVLTG